MPRTLRIFMLAVLVGAILGFLLPSAHSQSAKYRLYDRSHSFLGTIEQEFPGDTKWRLYDPNHNFLGSIEGPDALNSGIASERAQPGFPPTQQTQPDPFGTPADPFAPVPGDDN